MRIWITHVCSHFLDVQKSEPQFLTAVQSLKLFRLTQVYVWMDYRLFNLESVSWKHYSAKGNPERHKRERVIPSHSHSDNCVFESIDHVPHNIPNSSH